jgi:hypothetical protein
MADDNLPPDLIEELRRLSHEFRRLHRAIYLMVEAAISHEQELEGAAIMAALDDLAALGTRIAAVTAALPTDIATAVAAQAAADQAAITTAQDALAAAQASAATAATELDAAISTLTGQVAALEKAAGVQPPPSALTITPTSITGPVGTPITQALSAGPNAVGTVNFTVDTTAPSPPSDVTLSATGTVSVGAATAETGTISVIATDADGKTSASTPISVSVTAAALPSLTVTPSAATIAVGSTGNTPVTVTGGSGAISASGLPAGITWDGTANLVADGTQAADVSTVTFTDSSTPSPLTGTLTLTIQ